MAEVEIEFGRTHTAKHALSFTRADKDRILQNFPDKISVTVPGFGPQEYPLRAHVKAFFDAIQPPTAKIAFAVRGDADDLDAVAIEATQLKVIGVNASNFHVGDTDVSYRFDVDLEASDSVVEECPCADNAEGQRISRTVKLVWDIAISIDPGIGGVFEVGESEIVVVTPCVCLEEPEMGEGEDDEDRAKKKAKKKSKRGK